MAWMQREEVLVVARASKGGTMKSGAGLFSLQCRGQTRTLSAPRSRESRERSFARQTQLSPTIRRVDSCTMYRAAGAAACREARAPPRRTDGHHHDESSAPSSCAELRLTATSESSRYG